MSNAQDRLAEIGKGYRQSEAIKRKKMQDAVSPVLRGLTAPARWLDENVLHTGAAEAEWARENPQQEPLAPSPYPSPPPKDPQFEQWYAKMAQTYNLPPDPDQGDYDYKTAYYGGVKGPDANGMWPSAYKRNKFQ